MTKLLNFSDKRTITCRYSLIFVYGLFRTELKSTSYCLDNGLSPKYQTMVSHLSRASVIQNYVEQNIFLFYARAFLCFCFMNPILLYFCFLICLLFNNEFL
uniref:Uncharacterized protein n=1 Tax=Cacopsylla melanoneura TaxID=428564 RepID=A0A8D8ZU93_9HEMI